ncbi:hypothetical protein OAL34_00280 [Synechococcus sp. AH-551-G03]|nr:hypothetical protein [Synechococcus sp. AH-551-G03]
MRKSNTIRNPSLPCGPRRDTPVAEFIDPIASGSSLSLLGSLVGAAALGIFALWQNDTENDDDDSSPGGGLMQPVA